MPTRAALCPRPVGKARHVCRHVPCPQDPKARSLDAEDDDAYGEYYPGMVGAVGAIGADSDEEGGPDLAAMDSKNAKGMTR